MNVSAVIVTRGDVDLTAILEQLSLAPSIREIIVWENGQQMVRYWPHPVGSHALLRNAPDLGVYGRYAAVTHATHDVVYVQDDDCLVDAQAVIDAYEPGRLVANMPQSRWPDYPDSTLVGWGAVFDRRLPYKAWVIWIEFNETMTSAHTPEDMFRRECDLVFSALTPRTIIDVGFHHLPWAETEDRMFRQPDHKRDRDLVLAQCRLARTWPDDDRRIPA